jgi:hypothetical protein
MKMQLQNQTSRMAFALVLGSLCLAAPRFVRAADSPDQVLTTVAAVRSLSAAEAAKHYPVKLHGVVTFFDEGLFSRFIQDNTAGIYFQDLTNMPVLEPGQTVEMDGVTGPGEYAPVVIPASVSVTGRGVLPAAQPVSAEQLAGGREDSQFVVFSGLVRSVHLEKDTGFYVMDLAKDGEHFTVYAKKLPVAQPDELVDSTVKVSGVCATMFNHQRQLFGIRLLVPAADGVAVEKPAPANPFQMPAENINSLLQFTPGGTPEDLVKVVGTVVYSEPGSALFIENKNAGLYCQTRQRDLLQPGDQVEVLGFPAKGDYTPVLEDAIYRKTGTGSAPQADAVDVNQVLTGTHDCRLVQLQARVLDRVQRGLNQFLLLQSDDFTFQAFLPQRMGDEGFDSIQNGSEVKVTGICLIERGNNWQAGEQWRAASFHLLLRSPADVSVLQAPSAVKVPDLLWVAVVCGAIALATLFWVAVLRIKIRLMSTKK